VKLRIILLFTLSALLAPARAEEAAAELAPAAVPEVTPETVPALPAPDSAHPAHPIEQPLAPTAEAVPSAPSASIETPAEPPAVASPALNVLPGREGYAFGKPEILVRQRLFGLAHGVSLLAAACLDLPEQSASIQNAYAAWHAQHAQAIETHRE